MNPAVGITKIFNYLEESLEIIEDIKKNNEVVSSLNEELNYITEIKDKLMEIVEDKKLSKIEKIQNLTILCDDSKLNYLKNIVNANIKIIDKTKDIFLEALHDLQDNRLDRLKMLEGQHRLNWFLSWEEAHKFNLFRGIINGFSNWEYPVMEIFPGSGKMLSEALSAEPLYIVDWDDFVLEKCSSQFNEYYANKRLMKYKIKDYDFSALPQNSFGFVYSINQTLIENLNTLTDLSKNVFNCLLPGGIFLFVYNSSNYWWSVENIINHGYGITDKNELEKNLKEIGFDIQEHKHNQEVGISYVIVKKPGEIEYIKNSSILANIIDKPNDLM